MKEGDFGSPLCKEGEKTEKPVVRPDNRPRGFGDRAPSRRGSGTSDREMSQSLGKVRFPKDSATDNKSVHARCIH